jgi:hypothetical protein
VRVPWTTHLLDWLIRCPSRNAERSYVAMVWSVPAFMDTELGCQLTELPIS